MTFYSYIFSIFNVKTDFYVIFINAQNDLQGSSRLQKKGI